MTLAKHDWSDIEDGGYVPKHFTRGCIGCDGQAELSTADDDDFCFECGGTDVHEDDCANFSEEEPPTPLTMTLAVDWCFECRRRIDPLGWLDEHLDRFLWMTDELIAFGEMVKERIPGATEMINDGYRQMLEVVEAQFGRFKASR